MTNPQRLDPSLLTAGQGDEESQLNQLRLGEMRVQLLPELVVSNARIPQDGARVAERRLLAVVEPVRIFET